MAAILAICYVVGSVLIAALPLGLSILLAYLFIKKFN